MIKSFLILILLIPAVSSYAQTALDAKQKSIVTISAFTANGETVLLKRELNRGLDAGLTINEIKEVLYQIYAYAGFPRSLNAITTFQAVLLERQKKGINDTPGKESVSLPSGKSKYEIGTENLTRLAGSSMAAGSEFAPTIERFLKEHLFADIFGRDNLDWKTRELATISALASLQKAENQLRSHMAVGMRNGLTAEQLRETVSLITEKIGKTAGDSAAAVLQKMLGTNVAAPAHIQPTPNMTGNVSVQRMEVGNTVLNVSVAAVNFAPGARSYWHSHEDGQILIVTQGCGYYQEKGKPSRLIKAGETIICPPNVSHWHGASSSLSMTHTSITSRNGRVNWMQPVTEQEYNSVEQ